MPSSPFRVMIVSGYFNPLHVGHLDMLEHARRECDWLVVIVNNDKQQRLKKGKVITSEQDRLRIVLALELVDDALIAIDEDTTVRETLEQLAHQYQSRNAELVFANGGDRSNPDDANVVAEAEVCKNHGIKVQLGVGGTEKADSSTRINAALGVDA